MGPESLGALPTGLDSYLLETNCGKAGEAESVQGFELPAIAYMSAGDAPKKAGTE